MLITISLVLAAVMTIKTMRSEAVETPRRER